MWTLTIILIYLDIAIPIAGGLGIFLDANNPYADDKTAEKMDMFLFKTWRISLILTPIIGLANTIYYYCCCIC